MIFSNATLAVAETAILNFRTYEKKDDAREKLEA